ncbi:MAG: hypothetical protein PW734_11365 [Verrucomicrobium sp.]|nr:hypothetical protein [Verrucomicrobium sp.]
MPEPSAKGTVPPLSDYLAVSSTAFKKSDPFVMAVEADGWWFGLRKPLEEWPSDLLAQWRLDLGWIFPQIGKRAELPPAQQKVALCLDVAECRFKAPGQRENRECSRYGHGICSEATWNATDGKQIGQAALAYFYGMSFKQLRALQEETIRGWINDIMADPVLREYIEHLGLSGGEL